MQTTFLRNFANPYNAATYLSTKRRLHPGSRFTVRFDPNRRLWRFAILISRPVEA